MTHSYHQWTIVNLQYWVTVKWAIIWKVSYCWSLIPDTIDHHRHIGALKDNWLILKAISISFSLIFCGTGFAHWHLTLVWVAQSNAAKIETKNGQYVSSHFRAKRRYQMECISYHFIKLCLVKTALFPKTKPVNQLSNNCSTNWLLFFSWTCYIMKTVLKKFRSPQN